ncbi:hypothetical protein PHYPO_G00093270 [Pangasianodon hypophthalmus]|uniref:Tumor necrosis factor alpha-induced protein 2 n=1 Tax=Pangasianodon hypophthalmus TaxID=310915 RepID=A0A5N5LAM3_PANHP|nr:hypothetical protein PHYPO_G00093270 [Pangasianodon hypophthalmus]
MNEQTGPEAASAKHARNRQNEVEQLKTTDSLPEHKGAGGDTISIMMVEETKTKSSGGTARGFLNRMLKTKKLGKKHSSESNPEHKGVGGDSISTMMVKQTKKSSNGSARPFLNLTLKKKKSDKKHSSKSNPELLDFSQNLELGYLAEASQQLLEREKCLFSSQSSAKEVICTEDEKKGLRKDYETLMDHLKMAVHDSFNMENQEMLRSAIMAIAQQEEQDRHWEEAAEESPCWRPMRCRQIHDMIIKEVVEVRLQQVNEEELDTDVLKREVVQIGSVIQNDLLQVVNHVQKCYSSDFNVCDMYAQLYHQAFSTKLKKLLQFSVTGEDYRFILKQINNYPKAILQQDELNSHITIESLGALLTEEDHKSLEEQYLSHKEKEVKTWLSNALKLKEADWQANKKPELIDEYYFCNLALDVIAVIDGAIKDVGDFLGNDKAQQMFLQMGGFLMSYKNSVEEFLKCQQTNMAEIMKAQLFNISKIRERIEKQENLPDEMKVAWLSIASELRDSSHSYFLSPIHKELKVNYRELWTPAWFSKHEEIIGKLEATLNEKIHSLKGLHSACLKELLSQLHFEVMIEYVKRMLKRKLKLKNKDKQEAAACFLCQDSDRINTLFYTNGSEKEWLSVILPRVSEVIKEQDPENLELEICVLLKHHPDLSERQVCQLLQLKNRCPDVHMVRECYHQSTKNLEDSEPTPAFFCHVPGSISLSFFSCFCTLPFFRLNEVPCRK